MPNALAIVGGCLVLLGTFALGAAAGWYAAQHPAPVVLDERLQNEVEYLRGENDRLRREVEQLQ